MSHWFKKRTIFVLFLCFFIKPAIARDQSEHTEIKWVLSEIICLGECSSDLVDSFTPYLNHQLGFGANRPTFDLLDQCEGTTELQVISQKTNQVIQQIKNAFRPGEKLDFSKLRLPKPELQTAWAICRSSTESLLPDGDFMFKIISIEKTSMIVWFENQIFLRFKANNCDE